MVSLKIGIIGSGFAALRIYKIIKKLNQKSNINIYSKKIRKIKIDNKIIQTLSHKQFYKKLNEDVFFIANNTADHFKFLSYVIKKNKPIYIEKPLCSSKSELKLIKKYLLNFKKKLCVGYQFRENDCLKFIKKKIISDRNNIISIICYSGENVKKYHENENYLNSYTVSKKKGGGVILTQSHQIDYLNYLFDGIKVKKGFISNRNKILKLKTDVETNVSYICETYDKIPIISNINFFGIKKNFLIIFFRNKIIEWYNEKNLVKIQNNNGKIKKFFFIQTRESMFVSRIKNFLDNCNLKNTKKENDEIITNMENINNLKTIIR